jgi:hypothetical protein
MAITLRTPPTWRNGALFVTAILSLTWSSLVVRADALPLPPADQELVNKAIDRGVEFLKRSQFPVGTWPQKDENWIIGYTALPGLTLLECGVPADDPVIQRAAILVRRSVPNLKKTYEISLSILFLDRLGDPKDKKLIESLAMRLVAGQSPTGGWGYTCPVLTARKTNDLLIALRQTEPESLAVDLIMNKPKDGGPSRPSDVDPSKPGDKNDTSGPNNLDPGDPNYRSPGETPVDPMAKNDGENRPPVPRDLSRRSPRWGWCIKYQDQFGDRKSEAHKKYVVPPDLRNLVVFQDPKKLVLVDPPDSQEKVILATTDNSNTQFAVLALWAARRHDVPLSRTLLLIARRFDSCQNINGSWDYHYQFGGSNKEGPAVTAVGLIGLAVGHGLLSDIPGVEAGRKDPRIVGGFVALNRYVGVPTGKMNGAKQTNLYFLWSVERVAMLYNLQKIGDKDWYRWGAEMLVANQGAAGNWDNGQYWSAHPTIDTCFALLFLKRANLAKDLTSRLSIDPTQLSSDIEKKTAELAKPTPNPDEKPKAEEKPKPEDKPKPPTPPTPDNKPEVGSKGASQDNDLRTQSTNSSGDQPPPARPVLGYVLMGVGVLLLLGCILFLVIQMSRKPSKRPSHYDEEEDDEDYEDDEDDEEEDRRPRHRPQKHSGRRR